MLAAYSCRTVGFNLTIEPFSLPNQLPRVKGNGSSWLVLRIRGMNLKYFVYPFPYPQKSQIEGMTPGQFINLSTVYVNTVDS